MSFVARNHPQQVAMRGPLDDVDDRRTPPDRPGWTVPTKGDRPPFGLCLVVWGVAR